MSWQDYVDNNMLGLNQEEGKRHLDKGIIYSAAGDSVWAATPGFKLDDSEIKVIVAALAGGAGADNLWTNGLKIAGERYVVTKVEGRSIYARKGRDGVIIVKTTIAILIGYYQEPHIAGNAATVLEQLADYMIANNS